MSEFYQYHYYYYYTTTPPPTTQQEEEEESERDRSKKKMIICSTFDGAKAAGTQTVSDNFAAGRFRSRWGQGHVEASENGKCMDNKAAFGEGKEEEREETAGAAVAERS